MKGRKRGGGGGGGGGGGIYRGGERWREAVCVRGREGQREGGRSLSSSTAPTGYPRSIRSGTVTPHRITVHWEEVDCLDRNGAITGYVARALSNGREEGTASVGGDDSEATISGLTPSTQYIVQVAAVNSAVTGPYSPIALYETEGSA